MHDQFPSRFHVSLIYCPCPTTYQNFSIGKRESVRTYNDSQKKCVMDTMTVIESNIVSQPTMSMTNDVRYV